jgi:hypothetical protein
MVSTLNEQFNLACISSAGFPSGWLHYNPVPGTDPKGAWNCTPNNGKDATPGLQCTGYYDGDFHLDSSFLITPKLNLSGYAENVYLSFDSKATKIHNGGKLSVIAIRDTIFNPDTAYEDISPMLTPIIGPDDSTDWVHHSLDITAYAHSAMPFVLFAFLYTSTATTGNIWYLDNVAISSVNRLPNPETNTSLPITVVGASTPDNINIQFTALTGGDYYLCLQDLNGRVRYTDKINAHTGLNTFTIANQQLTNGLYVIKLNSNTIAGVTKVIVND